MTPKQHSVKMDWFCCRRKEDDAYDEQQEEGIKLRS